MDEYKFLTKKEKNLLMQAVAWATEELDATPCHLLDEGNPNHPRYNAGDNGLLFGYSREEFLAKQYK